MPNSHSQLGGYGVLARVHQCRRAKPANISAETRATQRCAHPSNRLRRPPDTPQSSSHKSADPKSTPATIHSGKATARCCADSAPNIATKDRFVAGVSNVSSTVLVRAAHKAGLSETRSSKARGAEFQVCQAR